MHIPFLSRPRSANIPAWTPLVAGFGIILVIAGAVALVIASDRQSVGSSLRRFEAAVEAGDADAAMAFVDVNALAKNVLLRIYAKNGEDRDAEERATRFAPKVAKQYDYVFRKAIRDKVVTAAPEASIVGGFVDISERPVVSAGDGLAYVDVFEGRRFMLRKTGSRWVITDFVGFEERIDEYTEQVRDVLNQEMK